jgi:nucleoside phosphorylase
MPRRLRREDYTVGWVCALAVELAAAQEMLDEEDETPQASAHETNIYTCGRLGEHNVVIACLPEGQIGTNSAAAVAVQMKSAFTSIRFGLMVGIGGGVPGGEADIRLGDVVVSKPHTVHSGVVQYDLGKATLSGFKRTGYLDNPPTILLTAVASVQANKYRGRSKVSEHMAKLDRLLIFRRDKAGADVLFNAAYDHEGGQTCDKCSEDKKETRQPRDSEGDIVVHYGTIASGNQVMRNGVERDRVSAELGGVLYFEMEAAGLMNNFPYLVIRGICDYADSHKNKRWQPYAAGTAAAYAKEVLSVILPIDVANSSTVEEATRETDGYVYIGNRADGNVYGGLHLPSGSGAVSGSTGLVTQQCLHDLRVTDPRDDRARIEQDKDKLLKSCYSWILDDASFQRWKTLSDSRLLWVKGDPGKGKTMMTMGIIAELSQRDRARTSSRTMSKMLAKLKFGSQPSLLAYFFCQSTRPELNNAVSVLRGLIYMLVKQKGQLMRHVQKRYEATGSKLFEGPNAIYALKEILSDILNDPTLPKTYLIIDALDECISGLSPLLHIITDDSLARQSKVKWLVTSRNVPDIERYLQTDLAGVKISLEISASHVSKAVAAFVDYKMQRLAAGQKYDYKTRAEVQQQLYNKAEGTFLWVSLVCKELERVPMYRTRAVLQAMPPGLDPLYDLMMTQIMAQKHVKTAEYCKSVLQSVTVAFRPLRLEELVVVAGLPNDQFDHVQKTADLVSHCGSFLTVRQNIVSFIHLSAKDYFTSGHGQQIFHGAVAAEQGRVTHRLLNQMHSTLQRDMCGMQKPRARTQDETERFKDSALGIAYACEYWVDHLCDSNLTYSASYDNALHDGGIVDVFLQEKFLYWLEALSLCKSVPKGVVSVAKLWSLIQACSLHNTIATIVC